VCRGLLYTTYFSSRCRCDWGTSLIDIQQTSSEGLYSLKLLCEIDGLVKTLCDFHTSELPSQLACLFLRLGICFIISRCSLYASLQISNRLTGQFSRHTGCFKKSFTTLKAYVNLFRGQVQCYALS
jgi:hypothetical protein